MVCSPAWVCQACLTSFLGEIKSCLLNTGWHSSGQRPQSFVPSLWASFVSGQWCELALGVGVGGQSGPRRGMDGIYSQAWFLFSSSFRREVLASEAVLGMPSRADWRSCQAGREEEAAAAQEFSQAFAPFDPAEMD